jgi:transcription termination factor Rho
VAIDHGLDIGRIELHSAAVDQLTEPQQLKKMYILRRILNPMGTMDAIDFLLDKLRNTKNNAEFFESMNA